jgi:hypothetical protein
VNFFYVVEPGEDLDTKFGASGFLGGFVEAESFLELFSPYLIL